MPKVVQYRCKTCSAIRGEANHWWEIAGLSEIIRWNLFPVEARDIARAAYRSGLVLRRFTGADGAEYFCGRECANKEIEAWMERETAATVAAAAGGGQ